MKKLHIASVKPGDVVARSIFLENGNILLGQGVELTDRYIQRLIRLGIDTLYIQDKHTDDIIPDDVMDGYFFHHAVNVAVLAGVVDLARGYNQQQLMDLGIGALLFDIGMTQVPSELWKRPTALTDEERQRLRYHTEEGFNILRHQHDFSVVSAHYALQHHERYDGFGYPRHLAGKEIHEYARIVAICDVYDALVSPRPYQKRFTPGEAAEYLFAAGNKEFDLELLPRTRSISATSSG